MLSYNRRVPSAFDEYWDSHYRLLVFIAAEFLMLLVGIAIVLSLMPIMRADAGTHISPLANLLLHAYTGVVAMFAAHVVLAAVMMRRLRGRALLLWVILGAALPFLIVFMPFMIYPLIYGGLFEHGV